MNPSIAIDTETTGLDLHGQDRPYAISTCDDRGNVWFCQWDVDPFTRQPKPVRSSLLSFRRRIRNREFVFHNAVFDIHALNTVGVQLAWRGNVHDTGIQSHVINSATHRKHDGKLKLLSLEYLDHPDLDEEVLRRAVHACKTRIRNRNLKWKLADKRQGKDNTAPDYWVLRMFCKLHPELLPETGEWNQGDSPEQHPWFDLLRDYAIEDARRTMMLHLILYPEIDDQRMPLYRRECRLIEVLYDMKMQGLTIFPDRVQSELNRYQEQSDAAISVMKRIAGRNLNPNSPDQLSDALFRKLKFRPVKGTATGKFSTDKDTIRELKSVPSISRVQKQFLDALSRYKDGITAAKYLASYLELSHGNRLFPSVNQVGTGTTRVSSSDPNGQNVGKGKELHEDEKPEYNLRSVFGPAPGRVWYCLDYSQLQLRIFAYLANEADLIQAFADGYDAHTYMAMRITGKPADQITKLERRIAKNVNFCFIFGGSPDKLNATAGIPGLWDTVTGMFPHAHAFMERTKREVYRRKYVTTPHGYRLYLPYKSGTLAAHAGVNYIDQGCEGDIVKYAMVGCHDYLETQRRSGFDGRLIFQVHDELIFDCSIRQRSRNLKVVRELKRIMEQPGLDVGMVTPVDIEFTTTNWSDTRKLKV